VQISRLFEIVYLLLNKKSTTANELAEHFEVSKRTILRDIDTLTTAGIPIYTVQGKGGGISILDNFVLNKTAISEEEQGKILLALQTVKAADDVEATELLERLSNLFQKDSSNWLEIDFSRWGIKSLIDNNKFGQLKDAIVTSTVVKITYYGSNSKKSERKIYPLKLIYKDKSWYLQGYCLEKKDYRVFKLSRIKSIDVLPEKFNAKNFTIPMLESSDIEYETVKFKFSSNAIHRIYDDFEDSEITQNADGSIMVITNMPCGEWIYGYLLSYGASLEVLEPLSVRKKMVEQIDGFRKIYKGASIL
jgi:predicted DNA-binding transcriptional regulator YafY